MTFPKCTSTLCKALCCLGCFNFFFIFFYVYSRMPIFKLKSRTVCESCLSVCVVVMPPYWQHLMLYVVTTDLYVHFLIFTSPILSRRVKSHCIVHSMIIFIDHDEENACNADWTLWHIVNLRQNESCPAVDVCVGVMSSANILSWHKAVCWLCQQNVGISL